MSSPLQGDQRLTNHSPANCERPRNGGTGFPACVTQPGKAVPPQLRVEKPPGPELVIKRRNLPHWRFPSSIYFVTFGLIEGQLTTPEMEIVDKSIRFFHNNRYWIWNSVVMPDHAHLLLKPAVLEGNQEFSLSKILQGLKGYSSREINKLRQHRGSIWLDESYDRIVRDENELMEKWNYIRLNPVKEGLADAPEDYPFLFEPGAPPDLSSFWK